MESSTSWRVYDSATTLGTEGKDAVGTNAGATAMRDFSNSHMGLLAEPFFSVPFFVIKVLVIRSILSIVTTVLALQSRGLQHAGQKVIR